MVEHLLAKEKVAGSNPVFRSSVTRAFARVFSCTRVATHGMLSVEIACQRGRGGMADAAVLKTAEPQALVWVRIPPSAPETHVVSPKETAGA